MSTPFVGQLQAFAFNFAPKGWAFCNGQTMPIQQNAALFSLLGTTYGGNGVSNFLLPNLMGKVPLAAGTNSFGTYAIGSTAGVENVTITSATMPAHNHFFGGLSAAGTSNVPIANSALTNVGNESGVQDNFYASDSSVQPMNPAAVGMTGGNQSHTNLQPYLVINWCIALTGLFPSRN